MNVPGDDFMVKKQCKTLGRVIGRIFGEIVVKRKESTYNYKNFFKKCFD
jgi:hypothetical protein